MFEDETANNLPQVKAGTLNKLIERATFDLYPDPEYVQQFLLTYRSFTTPSELLSLLQARFRQEPPANLKGPQLTDYKVKTERNIRLRIFNFCKTWVAKHFYDFSTDPELRQNFLAWINKDVREDIPTAPTLEKNLERAIATAEKLSKSFNSDQPSASSSDEQGEQAPKPILPPTRARALGILDFHPQEFARQLTILEFELYCKIKPWEFLGLAWAKPNANQRAPHILDTIQWTNRITSFVASEILRAKLAKGKIATINFFIKTLKYLYELHNFSAISAISAGFQHAAVHRLRPYWGEIAPAKIKLMDSIVARVSSEHNFAAFRAELKQTSLPLIPYTGMYLTDLTFMDEGNPDNLKSPQGAKLINFSKRRRISLVIRDIQSYQLTPYVLIPVKVIQSYIKGAQTYDDQTLYQISEQTIPRSLNKLSLRELEAAEKEQGADAKQSQDRAIEAIIGKAEENINFGELEHVPGYPFYDADIPGVNIVTVDEGGQESVMAGTLAKLVERLTFTKRPDIPYMETFIYSWSSFCKAEDLIEYLRFRFDVPMPVKGNLDTRTKYKQLVVSPTQLRVCNAMKFWVEKSTKDFLYVPNLASAALGLMEHVSEANPILVATSQRIIETLRLLADGQEPHGRNNIYDFKDSGVLFGFDDSPSINLEDAFPFNVSPREVAREIAGSNQQLFLELCRPCILIEYIDNPACQPRIKELARWAPALARWVASIVLKADSIPLRVRRVSYLIELLTEARSLRDYQSFVGLQLGLSHAILRTLEVTFKSIDSFMLTGFAEYKDLRITLQGYDSQRDFLRGEGYGIPVVPFVPAFISELEQFHHIPKTVNDGLINFHRAKLISSKLSQLMLCQASLFPYQPSERLRAWISLMDGDSLSDQELEARSKELEAEENLQQLSEQAQRESVLAFTQSVKTALLEDPLVRESLSSLLSGADDSDPYILQFRSEMSAEIQAITARFVTGNEEFEELATQALVERFGNESLSELAEWVHPDQGGIVYGWPEQISLTLLRPSNGAPIIIFLQPTINGAGLAAMIRKKNFYLTCSQAGSAISCLALASYLHPSLLSVAQSNGIEPLIIRSDGC